MANPSCLHDNRDYGPSTDPQCWSCWYDADETCKPGEHEWDLTEIECTCGDDRCVVICTVCFLEDRACEG